MQQFDLSYVNIKRFLHRVASVARSLLITKQFAFLCLSSPSCSQSHGHVIEWVQMSNTSIRHEERLTSFR